MKQIDIVKTYAQKHCLVVDDLADMRSSVKRWCMDFGCKSVDTAGSGEEALEMCQRGAYDLLLVDYHLGKGKNGQQLLEEIRFQGFISNSALFVMMTGEPSIQNVLHTIEFQPDDYLYKPLNREALRQRLNNALLKNAALIDIKLALDQQAPDQAIAAALKALKMPENAKYRGDIIRCLGELYCENGQWREALDTYQSVSNKTPPLWCRLGEARAKIYLREDDSIETGLLEITMEAPLCLEARDLLAEFYSLQNNDLEAQKVLEEGIRISPLSARRQRALGLSAQKTQDSSLAVRAFRDALKNSRNTCNESPEDFINLAQNLTNLSRESEPGSARDLANEALETLKQLDNKYYRHPVIQIRSKLIAADVYDAQGEKDKSRECTDEALTIHDNMDYNALEHTSTQLCIDCAKAFMSLGYFERGERLLEKIASINGDPLLATQIDKLRREPTTHEGILHAAALNKTGIKLYQNGEYEEAQTYFEKVLNELPNHIGLNLNLIQSILGKINQNGDDSVPNDRDTRIIQSSFARLGEFPADAPNYARYQYLLKKADRLQNPAKQ